MRLTDFGVGREFFTAAGKWRCTDVGTRTVVAMRVDRLDGSWYNGPPYAVEEVVFDENDIEGCSTDATEFDSFPPATQRGR